MASRIAQSPIPHLVPHPQVGCVRARSSATRPWTMTRCEIRGRFPQMSSAARDREPDLAAMDQDPEGAKCLPARPRARDAYVSRVVRYSTRAGVGVCALDELGFARTHDHALGDEAR